MELFAIVSEQMCNKCDAGQNDSKLTNLNIGGEKRMG